MATRTRPLIRQTTRLRARRALEHDATTLLVVALVTTLVWVALFHEPGRVDLEITNPTAYDIGVEVQSGPNDGWMPIGIVPRESTRTVHEVFDLGGHWTFRFTAQGVRAGLVELSRVDLEAAGWKLDVPLEVEHLLHDQGAPRSPLSTAAPSSAGRPEV